MRAQPRLTGAISAERQLTERDHQLLDLLADHQVLTTEQIARLLFASPDVARKRLVLLTRRGVLARFRACQRPGSQSWRYTLGPLGAIIHAAAADRPLPTAAKTHEKTLKLARSPRLQHLLGVNDFFVNLATHARAHDGCALTEWLSERDVTDACARIVRPDGYGQWRENGRSIGFFLEYDTGTETLDRLVGKLDGYRDLVEAGINRPVLFVLPGGKRQANFHDLAANPDIAGRVPVATTTGDDIATASAAGRIWLLLADPARYCLIDLSRCAENTAHLRNQNHY